MEGRGVTNIINWKDVPKYCETSLISTNKYSVTNPLYSHIYDLQKVFKPTGISKCIIIEEGTSNGELIWDTSGNELYKDFGYYFIYSDGVFTSTTTKRNLIIVPENKATDDDTFREYINSNSSLYGIQYTDVLFEVELDSDVNIALEQSEALHSRAREYSLNILNNYQLREVSPVVLEDSLSELANLSTSTGIKIYKLIDLSKNIIEIYGTKNKTYEECITDSYNFIHSFSNREVNTRIIYYLDTDQITTDNLTYIKHLYMGIAAYLNYKYGHSFYIEQREFFYFNNCIRNMTSLRHNTLNSYLRMIGNPIDCGLVIKNSHLFIHTLDVEKLLNERKLNNINYNIDLRFLAIKYSTDTRNLIEEEKTEIVRAMLKDIEIVDYTELYDLTNKDKSICMSEYNELNLLFTNVERKLINENSDLYDRGKFIDLFTCTFFRYKGSLYLGYLDTIKGKYPYKSKPYVKNYSSFDVNTDVNMLHYILPLTVAYSYDIFLKNPLEKASNKSIKGTVELPDTAIGFLISVVEGKYIGNLSGNVPLDFNTIGLWSSQTSKLRNDFLKELLTEITSLALRKNKLVSCYGGPHPSINTEFRFKNSTWRE